MKGSGTPQDVYGTRLMFHRDILNLSECLKLSQQFPECLWSRCETRIKIYSTGIQKLNLHVYFVLRDSLRDVSSIYSTAIALDEALGGKAVEGKNPS